MDEELLLFLQDELGEIVDWEELCHGVYYLTIRSDPESEYPWSEYYLVLDNAPISQDARALGRPFPDTSALLYPIGPPDEAAWTAVMYELCRNGHTNGIEGWSLTDAAMEGMELCPAYGHGSDDQPKCPQRCTGNAERSTGH